MSWRHEYDEDRNLDHVTGATMEMLVSRVGAELIGLTWKHPRHGEIPLLWRNGQTEPPPKFWKSHAPVLFPIVGGIHGLKSTTSDGRQVWFKKQHGFARHSSFELVDLATNKRSESFALKYRLNADKETLSMYPWRFVLDVVYELHPNQLVQSITVANADDRPMPFQLGWHPGFNTPFRHGEKARCRLQLPPGQLTLLHNDEHCYLTGTSEVIDNRGWPGSPVDFPFTEGKLDRTYMFDLSNVPPAKRVVALFDPDGEIGVKVLFADYPHLGIWSDAGAPFICVEPWQGMDDAAVPEPFDKKFGITLLPPGQCDVRHVTIKVTGN